MHECRAVAGTHKSNCVQPEVRVVNCAQACQCPISQAHYQSSRYISSQKKTFADSPHFGVEPNIVSVKNVIATDLRPRIPLTLLPQASSHHPLPDLPEFLQTPSLTHLDHLKRHHIRTERGRAAIRFGMSGRVDDFKYR